MIALTIIAVAVATLGWRWMLDRAPEIRPHSVTRWRPRG
jgi:hypothetical protein